jgi:hypothetical protein
MDRDNKGIIYNMGPPKLNPNTYFRNCPLTKFSGVNHIVRMDR